MTAITGFPMPEQQLPAQYRAALRSMLSELVVTEGKAVSRPRTRPRRRYVLASAATAVVVGAGGAFAYSALRPSRPVTDKSNARCYSEATYRPGENFPGTTVAEPDSATAKGQVGVALDHCAALWRAGILQPGVPTAIHNPAPIQYPVPDLVACVLPDGRAAIFPGLAGTCQRLGLQGADPATPS